MGEALDMAENEVFKSVSSGDAKKVWRLSGQISGTMNSVATVRCLRSWSLELRHIML